MLSFYIYRTRNIFIEECECIILCNDCSENFCIYYDLYLLIIKCFYGFIYLKQLFKLFLFEKT